MRLPNLPPPLKSDEIAGQRGACASRLLRRLTSRESCAFYPKRFTTRMAHNSQHPQETSPGAHQDACGGRQAIVELSEISTSGLVFWSKHRFEIGSEVQIRIERAALSSLGHVPVSSGAKWVMLKGFVVACPMRRREDGSAGFHVSLLMEQHVTGQACQRPLVKSKMRWFKPPLSGHKRFGMN